MFLNKSEVSELTGYKNKTKQVEWLISRGYKFEVDKKGEPKVLKAFIEKLFGASNKSHKKISEPNFDAITQ